MSTPSITSHKAGFTLVELLVSLGIFSFAVTLTAGSYLMIVGLNNRAQAVALLANDTSFVLENMTRLIRTGTNYVCGGGDCPSGSSSFSFIDPQLRTVIYTHVPPVGSAKGYIQVTVNGVVDANPLTNPAVNITSLKFYVTGTSSSDALQPFVRMVVSGTSDAGHGLTYDFNLETAATMRGIDI